MYVCVYIYIYIYIIYIYIYIYNIYTYIHIHIQNSNPSPQLTATASVPQSTRVARPIPSRSRPWSSIFRNWPLLGLKNLYLSDTLIHLKIHIYSTSFAISFTCWSINFFWLISSTLQGSFFSGICSFNPLLLLCRY